MKPSFFVWNNKTEKLITDYKRHIFILYIENHINYLYSVFIML
jgi:hypothetical protein